MPAELVLAEGVGGLPFDEARLAAVDQELDLLDRRAVQLGGREPPDAVRQDPLAVERRRDRERLLRGLRARCATVVSAFTSCGAGDGSGDGCEEEARLTDG